MLMHLLSRSIILTDMLGRLRHKSSISLSPDLHVLLIPTSTPTIEDMAQISPENVFHMMAQACLRMPRHLPYDECRSTPRFLAVLLMTVKPPVLMMFPVHILGRDVSQNLSSSTGKAMV